MSPSIRRAPRLVVNAPAVVESIGQVAMQLHPNLATVFRRVEADRSSIGTKFPAVVRDLSTNGAFISGAPLPLLARVAIKFEVKRHRHDRRDRLGAVAAHGRLRAPGQTATRRCRKGFGVLFEAIPIETRAAIAALVARTRRGPVA